MSAPALPLAGFQAWMQAVLVHPDGADAGLRSEEARRLVPPEAVSSVVEPRGALGPLERLRIYASMYPLRMADALRADYPALAALLGERAFATLVHDYVAARPSRTYTLARLGDSLPAFVAAWGAVRRRDLRADVALLERAAGKVFDADDAPRLAPEALAAALVESGDALRLLAAPAFAVVAVRPGAEAVLDAFLEDAPIPSAAGRGLTYVAFYRRDFTVLRRSLEAVPGRLLAALVEGLPLGEALARASKGGLRPAPERVAGWLSEWLELGAFAAAGTADRPGSAARVQRAGSSA